MIEHDHPNYASLIYACRLLLFQARQKGPVTLKHSFRKENAVAHVLARDALIPSNINKLCLLATPLEPAMTQYERDMEGFCSIKITSTKICTKLDALGKVDALEGCSSNVSANCGNIL